MLKKYSYLFVLIIFLMIMSACGSSTNVFESLEANKDDVRDYAVKLDLDIAITNEESKEVLESSQAILDAEVIEESGHGSGSITSINNDLKEIIEYYSLDDVSYTNVNGQGWSELSEEEFSTDNTATYYHALAKIVADIEDDLKVETKDNHYVLTYKGKNADIFEAFKKPYSLSLTGLTPADVEQDIEILVNKDTFFIEHLKNTVTGSKEGLKLTLSIDHKYDQMNKIDKIVVPKEILDQL